LRKTIPSGVLLCSTRCARASGYLKGNRVSYVDLEDFLKSHPSFEQKRKLLVLSELVYKPTAEKVVEGFRYFACGMDAVMDAFQRRDFAALRSLPFCLDEDGDPDTSGVRLDVAYTTSGSVVAAQPVEFKDYNPTPVAQVLLLEGEAARQAHAMVTALDQSS
jgi:hypothetical protein